MEEIYSEPAKVELLKYFTNSYDISVAAAKTCYSPRVVKDEEINEGLRERIGKGCYEGGHHTVFQHATFCFGLSNLSRQVVWAFLHMHPFYNSDQSSQRYVKLKEIKSYIPKLEGENLNLFKKGVARSWEVYNQLNEILLRDIIKLKGKEIDSIDEKEKKMLEKKSMEIARYVIPVSAHTSLYYTISGVVLYRLYKLMNQMPCTQEVSEIIGMMVEEVKKVDPHFFEYVDDPLPIESTIEYQFFKNLDSGSDILFNDDFNEEFDKELGEYNSKLISYLPNGEKLMADAVRCILANNKLSDEEAIDLVLDPKKNNYLLPTLNVSTISPLMRSMNHPYFVFKKKISHSADSQDQRHRMTPGSRVVLLNTKEPDYFTPELIIKNEQAKKIYDEYMKEVWDLKNNLLENGVDISDAMYILPNSVNVRFIQSSNFLNLWHKWRMRLCYTAQREIWKCSVEEYEQIKEIMPNLVKYVGPDCKLRFRGECKPFCTEGPRWCGNPVWVWKEYGERIL